MTRFPSTLLAQKGEPQEIQKADLDLLDKINRLIEELTTVQDDLATAETGIATAPLILHVCEKQAYNVGGGTFTYATDVTRVLNTVVGTNEIAGASLASNQITLPAGIYDIEWSAPGFAVARHWTWLFNVTGASITRMGTAEYCNTPSGVQTRSFGKHRVVLSAPTVFEIRHRSTATSATNGLGVENGVAGFDNIYTEVWITKVA